MDENLLLGLIIYVGADLRVCPGQPQRVAPTVNGLYHFNHSIINLTILSIYLLII